MKLPSNASKEWSGTCDDVKLKQEKLEAKLRQLLAEHQQADSQQRRGENPTEKQQKQQTEEPKTEEPKTGKQRNQKPKRKKQKWAARLKRLRRQAARIKDWLETHEPKIGKQGKEIQSNITENESANMSTSHGVIQGYNAQAVVDAKNQIIIHAEVFGNGQDAGHLTPMAAGAKANMQRRGHGEDYFEGSTWLADSNYHSDGNLKTCEEETLDVYLPDTNFRKRDLRFATQERHTPPKRHLFTREDCVYDAVSDRYTCPHGKELRLEARADRWGSGV